MGGRVTYRRIRIARRMELVALGQGSDAAAVFTFRSTFFL
jgi:hypothetical protein